MFKNFWWPLEWSTAVKDKPVRMRALGQDFVIFRTEDGRAQVMSDLCVHRGGALSDGWVENGCLVCPYHGWAYKPEGECVKIPANRAGVSISKKARVDSYPTREKYGFVWAFLGDLPEAERPPFPEIPIFDDPKLKRVTGEFKWSANYERVVENGADAAHAPFVHAGSFGNRKQPEVPDFEVEQTEWSLRGTVMLKPPPAKGLWGLLYKKERPDVRTTTGIFMPCITILEVNLPLGLMALVDMNIPIDDQTTLTKWTSLRSFFTGNWADKDTVRRVDKIFLQDQPIVEAQRPELVPFDIGAELHVKSDELQIAYRKMRQKAVALGYRIDSHKVQLDNKKMATVIPSPARRESSELANAWVMKEVPVTQNPVGENR